MLPPSKWMEVEGYAGVKRGRALVFFPESVAACRALIRFAEESHASLCPRGTGLSYGDSAINRNQFIVDMRALDRILSYDVQRGVVVCEPAVSFGKILERVLPDGWSIPACPGTPHLTVGGAVANNIHGKDSWRLGNFGEHVRRLKILTARGESVEASPTRNAELFHASMGGQGLLGIVHEIEIQLTKIPSMFVEVEQISSPHLDATLELLEGSKDWDFLLSWVDAFARGKAMGRGFVVRARWIEHKTAVNEKRLARSLRESSYLLGCLPRKWIWNLAKVFWARWSCRYFNVFFFHYARLKSRFAGRSRMLFTEFNFMHRKIPDFRQVYEPRGFFEFQPLVCREEVGKILRLCQSHKSESLLCAIKLHRSDTYPVSYSGRGFSIGIDVPNRKRADISVFANALQRLVMECGGKLYLAKNEFLGPHEFGKMYPRSGELRRLKSIWDSKHLFASDMLRRLGLARAEVSVTE